MSLSITLNDVNKPYMQFMTTHNPLNLKSAPKVGNNHCVQS